MTGKKLRAVSEAEHRCVAMTLDAWGMQCELTGGHDGDHWCRGFAGALDQTWRTGGPIKDSGAVQ